VVIKSCPICDSSDIVFETVLQNFPMGNIYLSAPEHGAQFLRDIKIFQCGCGHLSAKSDFSAEAIYNVDYSYLGDSAIPAKRRAHGLEMIKRHTFDIKFNNLIDIGCGNFELIKHFNGGLDFEGLKIGVDPVLRDPDDAEILFVHDFFENCNLDLASQDNTPNLICLDNVLEHIENLTDFFEKFVKLTQVNDYVYVCVPSFELMLQNRNFEEISHEHTQYFSLRAMSDLFARFEFEEIESYSKFIATRGYNFHFFQNVRNSELHSSQLKFQSEPGAILTGNAMSFSSELEIFKNNLRRTLPPSFENTWGVCASEVTPALCYFMGTNLEEIKGIFDTTSTKEYKFMPGLAPQVLPWENLNHVKKDSTLYITVPQLSSVVKPKLFKLGFFNVSFAEK
jgi:hypothetical protein